jgi:hypothetical protein
MNTLKEIGAVVALAAALAVILSLYMPPARADAPLYRAIGENPAGEAVEVVLHDEPCALDAIANLPKRATWTEPARCTRAAGVRIRTCRSCRCTGPTARSSPSRCARSCRSLGSRRWRSSRRARSPGRST